MVSVGAEWAGRRKWFGLDLFIIGSVGMFWTLLMVGSLYLVEQTRRDALANEQWRINRLRDAAAETLAFRLSQIDAIQGNAELLARAIRRGNREEINASVAVLRSVLSEDHPEVVQVAIADAQGRGVWSSTVGHETDWNIADREHFKAAASGVGKLAGRPVLGRSSGRVTSQFTRAMHDAAGAFAGVSVVSVDPAQLVVNFAPIETGEPAHVWVARKDGVPISERVADAPAARSDVSKQFWSSLLRKGGCDGMGVSPVTGVMRLRSCSTPGAYDLAVIVAVDAADVSRRLTERVRRIEAYALLTGLGVGIAGVAGIWFLQFRRQQLVHAVAGAARREVFSKLQLLVENISDAVMLVEHRRGHGYSISYATPSCRQILGIGQAGDIRELLARLPARADRQAVLRSLRGMRREQRGAAEVFRLRRADGTDGWMECRGRAVREGAGAAGVFTYIVALRDISDRVVAAEALNDARARLERLVANTPGVLYEARVAFRPGGRIDTIGALVTRAGGGVEAGAEGADVVSLLDMSLTPKGRRQREALLRQAALDGEASGEFEAWAAGGGAVVMRDRITRVGAQEGVITLAGYLLDVTQEHVLIQNLVRSSTLITLGEIASGISHELNQPLAAINFSAHNGMRLAATAGSQESVVKKFQQIIRLVKRAADVAEHIRKLSRGGGQRQPFDVGAAIENALVIMESPLRLASVEVTREIAAALPRVLGTQVGIEQVIINLLSNAIDAFVTNGVEARRITIRCAMRDGAIEIAFSDNAGGIPEDMLNRVFTPFVTTKASGKGMGLGMALSLRTVQELGGTMTVTNCDGGASFRIRLPVGRQMQAADAPGEAAVPGG